MIVSNEKNDMNDDTFLVCKSKNRGGRKGEEKKNVWKRVLVLLLTSALNAVTEKALPKERSQKELQPTIGWALRVLHRR